MDHDDLVACAEKWLKNSATIPNSYGTKPRKVRCPVVLANFVTSSREVPDAIGWAFGGSVSILVECKASRADFFADAKKPFRQHPQTGMGRYRYYFAPPNILSVSDLPPLWGLIEPQGRSVDVMRLAGEHQEYHRIHEMKMLWSALRRVQSQNKKHEKIPTKHSRTA